jgi:hypothetical protein
VKCVYKGGKTHYKMKGNYTRVLRMEQKHKTHTKKAVRDKRREEEIRKRN